MAKDKRMNLFNSFQAMAFYTGSPFLAQWLFNGGYNVWAYLLCGVIAISFVAIAIAVHKQYK